MPDPLPKRYMYSRANWAPNLVSIGKGTKLIDYWYWCFTLQQYWREYTWRLLPVKTLSYTLWVMTSSYGSTTECVQFMTWSTFKLKKTAVSCQNVWWNHNFWLVASGFCEETLKEGLRFHQRLRKRHRRTLKCLTIHRTNHCRTGRRRWYT